MKRVLTICTAVLIISLLGCNNSSKQQPEGGAATATGLALSLHDTIMPEAVMPEPQKVNINVLQANIPEPDPGRSVKTALNRSERPIDLGLHPLDLLPVNLKEDGYAVMEGGYADTDCYPDIKYIDYPATYITNNYYPVDHSFYYIYNYYFVDTYCPPHFWPPPYRLPHQPIPPRPPHKPIPPKPVEQHRGSKRPALPNPVKPQFADQTRISERSPIVRLPARETNHRDMITQEREKHETDSHRQREASRERQEAQERVDRERADRDAKNRRQQRESMEQTVRERQVAEARLQQEVREQADRERKEAEPKRQRGTSERQETESQRQQQDIQEQTDRECKESESQPRQQETQERENRERQEVEANRQQQESQERADNKQKEAESRRQQQEAVERADRERQEAASRRQQQETREHASRERQDAGSRCQR